jgi:hypothetical protein
MTTQALTNGPTKAYLGDAVFAEIDEKHMLKLTVEDGLVATDVIRLEREVWNMLRHYMTRHGAKLIGIALSLCCLAGPARAEDLIWNVVVTPQGRSLNYLEVLVFSEPELDAKTMLSFGPPDDTVSIDLGRHEAPWQIVHANGYTANGAAGLNTVIRVGRCELTIQGGLIVAADRCR